MLSPNKVKDSQIKVLLVESSLIPRAGLRLIMEEDGFIKVIAETDTLNETKALIGGKKPDVIVYSPRQDYHEAQKHILELRLLFPAVRILYLVNHENQSVLLEAVKSGVSGIVNYNQSPEIFVMAIKQVAGGAIWIDKTLMAQALDEYINTKESELKEYEKQKIESLTPREKQLIGQIGNGLRNKEIADKLRISEATVRHHLSSVFSKLEVKDRLGLVIYAYNHDLITNKNVDKA
jgi:two-component system, NarL family, response regulator DegU